MFPSNIAGLGQGVLRGHWSNVLNFGCPVLQFARSGASGYHSAYGVLSFSSSRQLVQARSISALISPPIRNDNPET